MRVIKTEELSNTFLPIILCSLHKDYRLFLLFFWKAGILTEAKKKCIIALPTAKGRRCFGSSENALSEFIRAECVLPEEGRVMRKMKKTKYQDDLPKRMYIYFISYQEFGAPSFSKFARSIGATLRELESFRKKKEFDKAYIECSEIRRDYLIDNALMKKFDPSFTKHILSIEYGEGEESEDKEFSLKLEVSE